MEVNNKNKINYNKTNPNKITNVYKSEYKQQRYMTDNEYKILWTIAWFIFLSIICLHFNSGWYLLLLSIWLFGLI